MAHSTIVFKHPAFGTVKSAPVGFSWTTALFGFWPALFRGDFKWAAIIFFVSVGAGIFTVGVGALIAGVAFAVFYNKIYVKDLQARGFKIEKIQSEYTIEQLQAQLETMLEAPAAAA
jgi:hypothetical protein